jgi:ABC-2 type transport system ATP-binding protein
MHSTPLIEPKSLAVETDGLGKWFGTRAALDGVDLEVPRGCAFGFLGANGAGKTTLIRLLLGLAEPTAGRMRLLGRDLPAQRAAASLASARSSRNRGFTRI